MLVLGGCDYFLEEDGQLRLSAFKQVGA